MISKIKNTLYLLNLVLIVLVSGCAQHKKVSTTPNTIKAVNGRVQEIQLGKDGYTALIKTAQNEIFYATISHSNLENPEEYKKVNVGDKLNVSGDFWKMEKENHITVRSILP